MKKILKGLLIITGFIVSFVTGVYFKNKPLSKSAEDAEKFKLYYRTMNDWLILKNEQKSLSRYFLDNGYSRIAIYGMAEMGQRLYEELKHSDVQVVYAIDQNADTICTEVEIVTMEHPLKEVDAVIITSAYYFEIIYKSLENKISAPIISIQDVIYDLL